MTGDLTGHRELGYDLRKVSKKQKEVGKVAEGGGRGGGKRVGSRALRGEKKCRRIG